MAISAVVLNYNGIDYLENCFRSLLESKGIELEITMIDNASTDDSVRFVMERFPEVNIVSNKQNLGFAKAYNEFIFNDDSEIYIILNNDIVLDEYALLNLVEPVNAGTADIVGPKLLYPDKKTINSAGIKISPIGVGYDVGLGEEDKSCYDIEHQVAAVTGACMAIKGSLYKELHGFDEDYFMYCEDVDLCWRALIAGKRILYYPKSKVYHHCGAASSKIKGLRLFYMHRNMLINVYKNFSFFNVLKGLFLNFMFLLVRIFILLIKLQLKNIYFALKGWFCGLVHIACNLKKRKQVQVMRKVSDLSLYRNEFYVGLLGSVKEYLRVTI